MATSDLLLRFSEIPWEFPHEGAKQKVFSNETNKIRLLHFDEKFREENWCLKGHIGYVIAGEMIINFNEKMIHYTKGDGLWINQGENNKHKVIVAKGKTVELILFETVSG